MKKPAIFMDAFLTDEKRHEIFNYNVSNFIKHGWDVFIISNKIGHFNSFSGVKYFEYDSRNRILPDRNRYDLSRDIMLYYAELYDSSGKYIFDAVTNTHGFTNWSLLSNMRKMAVVAKEFGHTHFITCEYDILFKNYNLMETIFKGFGETERSKNAMVVNHGGWGVVTNLYLISVDNVLRHIPEMKTEDDYERFLRTFYNVPTGKAPSPVLEHLFGDIFVRFSPNPNPDDSTPYSDIAELIPAHTFFGNIEEYGIHISGGDLGLRQGVVYKSIIGVPVNNCETFIINNTNGTPVFVEYTTNMETQYFLLDQANSWKTFPLEGRTYVKIRTSESVGTPYSNMIFDLSPENRYLWERNTLKKVD